VGEIGRLGGREEGRKWKYHAPPGNPGSVTGRIVED